MLASIDVNDPTIPVHVRLINCDQNTQKHVSKYSNVIVQNDSIDNRNKHYVNKHGVHTTGGIKYLLTRHRKESWGVYTREAFYSCMIKYDTIVNLIDKHDRVVYVDVDTIVRGSIRNELERLPKHDIGLFFDKKVTNFPHAGLIVCNNTDTTKKCMMQMKKYFDEVLSNDSFDVGEGDGELLYETCTANSLNILRLSDRWKDEGQNFDRDSLMWSGRSERKLENTQYINEYNKYLKHDKQN